MSESGRGRRRFGDYELLEGIGQGGMGQVHRARSRDSDRLVALELGPSDAQLSAKRLVRFRREGEITAALRHPNIVPVHAAGISDGRPFLAYRLVERGIFQASGRWQPPRGEANDGAGTYPSWIDDYRQRLAGLEAAGD
jgi:serine/threonine protein kinase